MNITHDFEKLLTFIEKLPAIDLPAGRKSIGRGSFENGNWWVKFTLDTTHPLAWRHVQELGYVLNYVSLEERLPSVFMPVSPPPVFERRRRVFIVGHRVNRTYIHARQVPRVAGRQTSASCG